MTSKQALENKYYNASHILNHNAIYTFVISNKNYGKTWALTKEKLKNDKDSK